MLLLKAIKFLDLKSLIQCGSAECILNKTETPVYGIIMKEAGIYFFEENYSQNLSTEISLHEK